MKPRQTAAKLILGAIAALGCASRIAPRAFAQSAPSNSAQSASQPSEPDAPATQPVADEPQTTAAPTGWHPMPRLQFDELIFDIGFDAEWQRRQTITNVREPTLFPYRDRQTNSLRRLEETAGLRGSGYIADERFMRYEFDLRGGFSQETYRESRPGPDLRDSPNGDLFQYDARATIFPAGKLSANVFALKQDDRVPRMFLPSLERQRERYGAELVYSDRVLPMRLLFESSYEESRSFDRSLNDDERSGDRRLEYEATWQPTEYHQLRLDYEYDDRRDQYSGAINRFDTTRNYLTLNDSYQFGEDHKSRLDTVARFQDESGDYARDVYEFAPQLRLQHTDKVSSNYRFQYLEESFEGSSLELFRGDAGLNYRPNKWLDAGVNFYGLTEDVERGSELDEWGGVATASANVENALGQLSSNLSYNHASQHVDNNGSDGVVIGEAITLRDPLPTYLAHTDVKRLSIVVTDTDRRRLYIIGRDYYVVQVGRYTWLVRTQSGRITDGQTVLVSYLYRTAQDYSIHRDRVDFRVQQAFKNGFSLYYAASLQDESINNSRFLSYEPRDVNRHRVGLDYRQKRWFAGAELEYNDDGVDPYKAVHLRTDATVYERAQHSLNGRGNFSFLRFDGRGELTPHDTSLLDLGMSYRFLIDPKWDASATIAYRYEDDSLYGITHGVDVAGGVNWRIGQFTASVEIEYDLLDLPSSSDGTFAVWLKVRREFPLISRGQ